MFVGDKNRYEIFFYIKEKLIEALDSIMVMVRFFFFKLDIANAFFEVFVHTAYYTVTAESEAYF